MKNSHISRMFFKKAKYNYFKSQFILNQTVRHSMQKELACLKNWRNTKCSQMGNTSTVAFMLNDLLCHLGSWSLISFLDKMSIAPVSGRIYWEADPIQVPFCRNRNVQGHGSWQWTADALLQHIDTSFP